MSLKEFPNNAGAGQPFSSADTANLLLLFKGLRVSLGSSSLHKIVYRRVTLTSELLL